MVSTLVSLLHDGRRRDFEVQARADAAGRVLVSFTTPRQLWPKCWSALAMRCSNGAWRCSCGEKDCDHVRVAKEMV